MKLISIQITVPKDFFPEEETKPYTQQQNLTMQLGDYIPRMIEENLDDLPLLSNYEVTRDDVDVSYEEETGAAEGFWLQIHINLDEPRSMIVVALSTALRGLVLNWIDSKGVSPPPIVHPTWSWRQRSGRLR